MKQNEYISNENIVNLDIDYPFKDFEKSRYYKRINKWYSKYGLDEVEMFKRKSANGNTHICIIFYYKQLSTLENLKLRAKLGDDKNRIIMDLKRLDGPKKKGLVFDRLWSIKHKNGKTKRVGRWIEW
jgi:hypothetical protein